MTSLRSPFKFLDPYQKEDINEFFGREAETAALYDALSGVKHLLVYGPSGSGKTSLVECGLRNQFSDVDWYALTIRRGGDMTASVFARINEALQQKMDLQPQTGLPTDPDTDFGQAIENLFSERYQPVYLLFDQFEELLISGHEKEKRDFFTRLNRLIRYKVPCRVLLIMREEFIGHLSEFEPLCPSLFQYRFRLEKMRRKAVQGILFEMLEAPRYRAAFTVENSRTLAELILSKLPDQQQEIELAYVQVFLSELWERANETRKGHKLPLLHAGLLKTSDNLETVLDRFLKNQLAELEAPHGDKAPLELLACMISKRHTKLQLSAAELLHELKEKGVSLKKPLADLLGDLESRRIVRQLKLGGAMEYEISHDILALVVGRNLTEEMKMRERAAEVYGVYEERKGHFSREDLDHLRAFLPYKPYPGELAQRVTDSEQYLLDQDRHALETAQRQAEQERVLREQAEAARVEAEEQRTAAIESKIEADKQKEEAQQNAKRARRGRTVAIMATLFTVALAIGAFYQWRETDKAKLEAQQSLIKSYKSEIRRDSIEISMANVRLQSYKLYMAHDSIKQIDSNKIKDLEYSIKILTDSIERLEIK